VNVDRLRWGAAAAEQFRSSVKEDRVCKPVQCRFLPGQAKLLGSCSVLLHAKQAMARSLLPKKSVFMLGAQVQQRPSGQIFLSQQAHLKDVLARPNTTECCTKEKSTEPGLGLVLSETGSEPKLKCRYLQAIRLFLHATLDTCSRLACAVGYLKRCAGQLMYAH
jgi:hypothetical protein